MKTFFIEYASKLRSIIHSDLESAEHFCNQHFGTTWGVAQEHGARVVMTDHNPDAVPEDMPEGGDPVDTTVVEPPVADPTTLVSTEAPVPPAEPVVTTGDVAVNLTGAASTTETGGAVTG